MSNDSRKNSARKPWQNIDWSKSQGSIAETLKATPPQPKSTRRVNWQSIDWSKSNTEIAREINAGYSTVSKHRPR